MRAAVTILILTILSNWTYQGFLSYNKEYCDVVDWKVYTIGFKLGCILSSKDLK